MTALPFKIGERIAIPYLPVLKVENNIAILKKARFAIGAECGARHRVRIEAPFYVRGGFRVEKKTMYKVPGWAFEVKFKTPYGSFVTERVPQKNVYLDKVDERLAEKLARETFGDKVAEIIEVNVREPVKAVDVYVRMFKHVEVLIPPDDYFFHFRHFGEHSGDTYFVYEFVSPDEAKLVDDVSRMDYVLLTFGNYAESRAGCATIKLLSSDGVAWSDVKSTCCRIASSAVAMAIAKHGSRVTIAMNNLPYRGCCETWTIEEWVAELPPRRVAQYSSTEPIATDVRPEEIV